MIKKMVMLLFAIATIILMMMMMVATILTTKLLEILQVLGMNEPRGSFLGGAPVG